MTFEVVVVCFFSFGARAVGGRAKQSFAAREIDKEMYPRVEGSC